MTATTRSTTPAGNDPDDLIRAVREIVRRALLTFKALPDRDARFLRGGNQWNVVHDANQAYGYAPATLRDFAPSAHEIDQASIVLDWLGWLAGIEGREATRRITAWAHDVPLWRIAQKERVSEKTIARRIDRSIVRIINELMGTDFALEVVEEPYQETPFAIVWDRPTYADAVRITTVYVYGKGLMRNGKPWDDGRRKAQKMMGRKKNY